MLWDILEITLPATYLYIGYRLGKRNKGKALGKEPQAICGCEHHYSHHDEDGCHFDHGNWYSGLWVSRLCTCKKYSGPEPLPKYIAGEL